MKRLFLVLFAMVSFATTTSTLTSCRDESESAGDKVENAADETGDAVEDAAEDVEDGVEDATN